MHKCSYTHEIKIVSGKIWLHVTAHYKKLTLKVYRECEDGRKYSRNLYLNPVGGYYVSFPGEKERMGYGYGSFESIKEPWGKAVIKMNFDFNAYQLDGENLETICRLYPDFRFVAKKCNYLTTAQAVRLLSTWKESGRNKFVMEWLMENGHSMLAQNRAIYRLKPETQKAVLEFVKKYPDKYYDLTQIQTMIKENISFDDYRLYENYCSNACGRVSYPVYKYLSEIPGNHYENRRLYRDFIAMAKKAGHKVTEKYWAYPKNLRAAHNKVMEEVKKIQEAEDARKLAERQAKYSAAVKTWLEKTIKTKTGVSVYIPETIEDIKAQAEALNQCLISCDYVKSVIEKKCILVFITYGKRRMATAEFSMGGKLQQFYGNEANRNDRAPSKSAKAALEQWQETYLKKVA